MEFSTRKTRRDFLQAAAGVLPAAALTITAKASAAESRVIFSEGQIAGLRLTNRLVRSATSENAWRDNGMIDEGVNLYRNVAAGGVGLIVTGAMAVMASGRDNDLQSRIYDDRYLKGLSRIPTVVHQTRPDCKVVVQMMHVGMKGHVAEPVGPTATPWPTSQVKPRALTTKEVEDVVANFAQAIRRAKEVGFNGAQIHGAHGYLVSSFLSPYTNTRTDRYGGSMEKRALIVREIVEQARKLVGPDFPILIKMNCDDAVQGGIDIDSFPPLAAELEKAGIQSVEVSGANTAQQGTGGEQPHFLKYAQKLTVKVPVIVTGANHSIERLEQVAKAGTPQFFGLARPLVREPNLPARWQEGRGSPEAACIACNRCLRGFAQGLITRCRVAETNL